MPLPLPETLSFSHTLSSSCYSFLVMETRVLSGVGTLSSLPHLHKPPREYELSYEEREYLVQDIEVSFISSYPIPSLLLRIRLRFEFGTSDLQISLDLSRIDRIIRCSLRSQGLPMAAIEPVSESSVSTVVERS
ncbi:hypothetical protein JHK85_025361 [Glycine max]|nr:hypothetical protein JHK85_025361 [Glycine max]